MAKQYNLLITCGGGLVIPGIVSSLRRLSYVGTIITVDMTTDAVGSFFGNRHYTVPAGEDEEYAQVLLDICRAENISIILPFSDEEVLALCESRDAFEKFGTSVLCPQRDAVEKAIFKDRMLSHLQKAGIAIPRYYLPAHRDDVVRMAHDLGYPDKNVIVKPSFGRGGRGVVTLQQSTNFLGRRNFMQARLDWFVESLGYGPFPKLVLMEYLSGQDYSVDCLCRDGDILAMVPKKRIQSLGGASQKGKVHRNEAVFEYTKEVAKAFGFTGNVNIQMRYSGQDDQRPLIYEINPRLGGTIAVTAASGTDLLDYGLRQALNLEPIVIPAPQEIKFLRYFAELYY